MISAVLFDLNGVFLQGPKLSDRMRDVYHVAPETFLPVLKDVLAVARRPGAPDVYSIWKPHLERWGIALDCQAFFDFWFGEEREVPEMFTLAAELRMSGLKLAIISNNFRERVEWYGSRFPDLRSQFDYVSFSWETGLVKPDPEVYCRALSELHAHPAAAAYFDDSRDNVAVASSLGIHAFPFHGADDVRARLRILGCTV